MKRYAEVIFVLVAGGMIVFVGLPFALGVCTAIGSGIIDATRNAEVKDWYVDAHAQIAPYVESAANCPPDEYCSIRYWWSNDIISNFFANLMKPSYANGIKIGAPMWNDAMSNGLIRFAFPVLLGFFLAALAKKILDKIWE